MKIYRTALVILAALAISASLPFASAAAQYGGSQRLRHNRPPAHMRLKEALSR